MRTGFLVLGVLLLVLVRRDLGTAGVAAASAAVALIATPLVLTVISEIRWCRRMRRVKTPRPNGWCYPGSS